MGDSTYGRRSPRSNRCTAVAFWVSPINTSIEPTTPAEDHRILMLNDLFLQELAASGRFKVVTIPADLSQEIASNADIAYCDGCERNYAQRVGADWAAWGAVQKVSNLILNINLYMEDARAGKLQFVKSVDIRGNTDETWRRGLTICSQLFV